jgi:hypothetical protein
MRATQVNEKTSAGMNKGLPQRTVPVFRLARTDGSLPEVPERTLTVPFTVRPDTIGQVCGSDAPGKVFAVLSGTHRLVPLVEDDTLLPMPPRGAAVHDDEARFHTDIVLVKSPAMDAKQIDAIRLEAEPAAPESIIGVAYLDKKQD